jgi:hypothetical protein
LVVRGSRTTSRHRQSILAESDDPVKGAPVRLGAIARVLLPGSPTQQTSLPANAAAAAAEALAPTSRVATAGTPRTCVLGASRLEIVTVKNGAGHSQENSLRPSARECAKIAVGDAVCGPLRPRLLGIAPATWAGRTVRLANDGHDVLLDKGSTEVAGWAASQPAIGGRHVE